MKIKSLKLGIILNLFLTLMISILTFLINKYFVEYLGIEKLGLMKLFTQMIAYLSLADLGLATATAYSLYKPLIEKDYIKINIVISTVENLYKKISLFILIIGLILNFMIPYFLSEIEVNKTILLYWSLYVLNTSLSYTYAKYVVLFTANQEYEFVRLVQGISKIIVQFLQIFLIFKYRSFLSFILLLFLDNIFQYIVYKCYYQKKYYYIKKVKEKDKNILKNLYNLIWHKIGGLIVFNTDYILISKFVSISIVGIYSNYLLVVNMVVTIVLVITNILNPRIGKYIAENSISESYILWEKLNTIFITFGLYLAYLTYKLINPFIFLWIGENKYLLSVNIVVCLSINLYIQITRQVTEIFKNGYCYFDDIYLPISEGIINLIFSIILVNRLGLFGVILGTLISNILIIYLAKPILVVKKCFNRNTNDYLKLLLKNTLLIFAVILFSEIELTILKVNFQIKTWGNWIALGIKLTILLISNIVLIFSLDKKFRNILKEIIKRS